MGDKVGGLSIGGRSLCIHIHEQAASMFIRQSTHIEIKCFSIALRKKLFGLGTAQYWRPNKFLGVQEHLRELYRCLVAYTCRGGEQVSISNTSKMEKAFFA